LNNEIENKSFLLKDLKKDQNQHALTFETHNCGHGAGLTPLKINFFLKNNVKL
jgi:hypothetical protein